MPTLIHSALEVVHDRDPREQILEDIAPYIDKIRIGGPDVLVVVYERSGRTKVGGLFLPDKKKDDDRLEGVSGLLVKLGPLAYKTEKTEQWFDPPPKVGDWVLFDVKTTHPFMLGPRTCRQVVDQWVRAVIDQPDIVE